MHTITAGTVRGLAPGRYQATPPQASPKIKAPIQTKLTECDQP